MLKITHTKIQTIYNIETQHVSQTCPHTKMVADCERFVIKILVVQPSCYIITQPVDVYVFHYALALIYLDRSVFFHKLFRSMIVAYICCREICDDFYIIQVTFAIRFMGSVAVDSVRKIML